MLLVSEKRHDQWNASQFEFNQLLAGQEAPLALERDVNSIGTLPLMYHYMHEYGVNLGDNSTLKLDPITPENLY